MAASVQPQMPAYTPVVDGTGRMTRPWLRYFQLLGDSVRTTATIVTQGGLVSGQQGAVSASFANGLVVSDGSYLLVPNAPYAFRINHLYYEVGNAGGSFHVTVTINGADVAGLTNIAVSNPVQQSTLPSGIVTVAQGDRVELVVSGTSGAPTNAVLTLDFTRA